MSHVLAVDPGVATGWALWHDGRMSTGIDDDQVRFCDFAWRWVRMVGDGECGVIVCESYRITAGTAKMTFQPASLEIIGFLRWLAAFEGFRFILQAPADKRFMPDRKLRSLGWFVSGSAGHDNDALRHLGIYLAKIEHNEAVLRAS